MKRKKLTAIALVGTVFLSVTALAASAIMLFQNTGVGAVNADDEPGMRLVKIGSTELILRHINNLPENSTYKLKGNDNVKVIGSGYPFSKAGNYYLEFGEYPRSYVGNTINSVLETEYAKTDNGELTKLTQSFTYNTANPTSTGSWNNTGVWVPTQNYVYTYNGIKYVRVQDPVIYGKKNSDTNSNTSTYDLYKASEANNNTDTTKTDAVNEDGILLGSSENSILVGTSGAGFWFYVEPIRWIITNWKDMPALINPDNIEVDNTASVATHMELLSVDEIAANVPNGGASTSFSTTLWHNGGFRKFLNGGSYTNGNADGTIGSAVINEDASFYGQAFTAAEKAIIATTALNNTTDSTAATESTNVDQDTNDKIFLLSYNQVFGSGDSDGYFNLWDQNSTAADNAKMAVATDYAVANFGWKFDRPTGGVNSGVGLWWLRSSASATALSRVHNSGSATSLNPYISNSGLRPALRIAIGNPQSAAPGGLTARYADGSYSSSQVGVAEASLAEYVVTDDIYDIKNNTMAAAGSGATVNLVFNAGSGAVIQTIRIGLTNLTINSTEPSGYNAVRVGEVYIRYRAWYKDSNSKQILLLKINARGNAIFKSLNGEYTVWAGSSKV
jgi:hypothetical protein